MTVYLWSHRWSPSRGWRWVRERPVIDATAADWLEVYTRDEPGVEFVISRLVPRSAPEE